MDDRGTLILGCPRSGTTLLRRIFDGHPRFACPGETTVFRAFARLLQTEQLAQGVQYGLVPGLELAGVPPEQVHADLRTLAMGWLDQVARRAGKPCWAEKSAVTAFHVPSLEAWLGSSVRYVILLREGLDTASSLVELAQRTDGYLEELHTYQRADPRILRAMIRAWADATQALLDLAERRPEIPVVRYEALVQHPQEVLGTMFAALGEDWQPEWLAAAMTRQGTPGLGDWKTWTRGQIDASSVGRSRHVDAATLRELAPVADPVLRRAGYAEIQPTPGGDDPRRVALAHHLAGLRVRG